MAAPALSAATAPPAPPIRPRTLLLGSALAGSAGAMAVLSMVAIYEARRSDVLNTGATWLPKGSVIPLP